MAALTAASQICTEACARRGRGARGVRTAGCEATGGGDSIGGMEMAPQAAAYDRRSAAALEGAGEGSGERPRAFWGEQP